MMSWATRAGRASLRSATVNRVIRTLARLRGNGLVLVYHRVGPGAPPGCEVIPTVPQDVFRAQLQALGDAVELVTLDALLVPNGARTRRHEARRPRVAITLDDDLTSHVDVTLPILCELGAPATFFLSGRSLHDLGGYWFQHLETLLVAHGEARAAAILRLPSVRSAELALACEASADLRQRAVDAAADLPAPEVLDRRAIATLAAAGMTIGFHTVRHDILPTLSDTAIQEALSDGRDDLAKAAGVAISYFAYPHGKTDARSEAAVQAAGFEAAFTGRASPLRHDTERYRLGRWEPGALEVDDFLVNLAVRLHRVAPAFTQAAL